MKKTAVFLIFICFILTAFAGCETPKEDVSEELSEVSQTVSEEMSEEVSEEVSEETSDEASEEVSKEVSKEVSDEVSKEVSDEVSKEDEVLTSVVGSWAEVYTEEDYADGYLWTGGFVFGENGCCVVYDAEYNVYEDENGDPVFEGCGGNSREGVYTLEGDTVTVVFDMSVQYGEGYTQTYKVSKKGENLIIDGVEHFLEAETGYVPEGVDVNTVYGLWESNEPDGDAYIREWWIFNTNGTFEYGKGRFVKADGSEPDTVIINGYLYKAESYEKQLKGKYTVVGAHVGTLTLTVSDEVFIYHAEVYEDWLTVFWQYDLENDIRSEYTRHK